jgi:hypothetical protein
MLVRSSVSFAIILQRGLEQSQGLGTTTTAQDGMRRSQRKNRG